jgi:TetR/AcrR family transcriptional regulator, repressor for uid operon
MRTVNPDLHKRRRAEIIAAAENCFLKQGFHQTSMQNIAAASGVSMGLLYRYFANKEAIIEAAAQQDQDATLSAINALPTDGEPTKHWVLLLTHMAKLASAADYAGLANEIVAEAHRSPKILTALQANDTALATAIEAKLAAQQIDGDLAAKAQSLLLIFDGLTMRHFLAPAANPKAIAQSVEQLITGALFGEQAQ